MPVTINLTTEAESIDFPATHYVFVERIGNIPANAPHAWEAALKFEASLSEHNQIAGMASLYKPTKGIYRAGFLLAAPPVDLPTGLTYEQFAGGKYARFVLTGHYNQLPEANTRAYGIAAEKKIALRDTDFSIEQYLTDPRTTPADQNVTAILLPTA
jgi:predicted transcriptional regulator YdeE